jgi:hypothetical protein
MADASFTLSADDIALLDLMDDPVLWAESFLKDPMNPSDPLKLRWYQREMIEHSGNRRVSRCGRGVGKTVCLSAYAIWEAFTKPNTRVLIIAPYESQVKLIFDDAIRPMIADSPAVRQSVTKDRSQPFWIEFTHGSAIVGMTAGTRSGQHASSIRGQTAAVLILDEADYLTPQAHAAIDAIIRRFPNVRVWASSTPTGKREWFYGICTDRRQGYQEFHYPSSVSPDWTDDAEEGARLTLTEEEYQHEYLAEWGTQAQGVFNPIHTDQCVFDYNYDDIDMRKTPGNIRVMGVDWNAAKNGVQIVIVELLRESTMFPFRNEEGQLSSTSLQHRFAVIRRLQISDKDMTQTRAINAILKMMAEYNVDHLYVDEGYGHTNVEDLYKAGEKYAQLAIKDKLKPVNFSGKVTIRDPQTRRIEEKPMKPYMVNNAKLRMEQLACVLPRDEDYPTGIVGQMRNYLVVRISDKGYPTYSSGNDHALDAWMIAMLGFAEEYSELKTGNPVSKMVPVRAEQMVALRDDINRSLQGDDPEIHRNSRASSIVEKAIRKSGLVDDYVYTGWDPNLSDDSDAALKRRERVNRHTRTRVGAMIPWGSSSKRNKYQQPRRTNITVEPRDTPWRE